ncbi:MAG TPA: adenylate/guanylate cyclase domain-containing protein, partial [Rhodospirillales bacterium]|nr:adenylate/guanylate cyclase domain-containing protein [Rhodospirillales bacterium]
NMTLRKKVLLIFLVAFVIFCSLITAEIILSSKLSQNRIFKAVLTGQTSTWRKVREATYERMLFYAYDAKPGKPSVWRLRGRRSPVQAVLSGNPKKVKRAILPLYKNLAKDAILDMLWVFDSADQPLFISSEYNTEENTKNSKENNSLVSKSILEVVTKTRESKLAQKQFVTSNGVIYATITFPIFANARVAGTVVYGRKINPLIKDLAINTKSEVFVFHSKDGFIFGTKPKLSRLAENRFGSDDYALLESGDNVFLANSLKFPLRSETVQLVFMLDMSNEYKKQRLYYLVTLALVILVAIVLTTVTNILLKRGFTPLDRAIDVLNALSTGDTSVDIEIKGNDEVSRIASTVSSFRKSLIEREKVRSLFGKYIPESIAEQMLKEDGALKPQTTEATIFFVDLAGFTAMSERLNPQEIVEVLNDYFSEIVSIIEGHNGVITQFQGDAVLAIFNVPIEDDFHALNAIDTAREIIDVVAKNEFCGHQLSCRIGITTGDVVAGNVGAKDRLNYTVHGDIVNLAARLEQLNKEFSTKVLIAASTVERVNNVKFDEIGNISVRGKEEQVIVYTLSS